MAPKAGEAKLRWKDALLILAIIAALAGTFYVQAAAAAPARGDAEVRRIREEAAQRFAQEDYVGARDLFRRATELDPGAIVAWRGLGWSLWRLGDEHGAVKIWNSIRKVAPNDPDTLLALAYSFESREDWVAADDLYTRVQQSGERHKEANLGCARIHLRLDLPDQAEACLRKALAAAPNDFEAQYLLANHLKATGREEEAAAALRRIAGQQVDPRFYRPMADVLLEIDRPEEALRYYRKIVAKQPDNRGTVLGMARALGRLQQHGPAITQLERYVDKHPDDVAMRELLIRYASAGGDWPRVMQHLQALIEQQPGEKRWYVALARAQRDAGNPSDAVTLTQAVLDEDAQNVEALELMLQLTMVYGTREKSMGWLETLTNADPTPRRLVRLGNEYLRQGDRYAEARRDAEALAARRRGADAFRRAAQADPNDADAALGAAMALRLSGEPRQALALARKIGEKHPALERVRNEMLQSHLALGDYRAAQRLLVDWRAQQPQSLQLREEFNRTRFHLGQQDAAIADMKQLLDGPIRQGIPVLLYHGLSDGAPADDTMPLKNFRDQMKALKEEGYTPIDMRQLLAFYRGGPKAAARLPKKPIFITFDDARADSFRYADPVLKQHGFRATMFTPTAEVGRHGEYNATWSLIRKMYRTGRWDIQCHSHAAHVPIQVDADGARGPYLANRMWLGDQRRLETTAEFAARLDADYHMCRTVLQKEVPGVQVAGYAYPFGELGQRSLSNEPEAVAINTELVTRYYQVGFTQSDAYDVTLLSQPARLERFEVPWDLNGEELVHRLHALNSYANAQLLLADLYSWDGRYARAGQILQDVSSSGEGDDAMVLARRGRMTMWQGDFAGARRDLATAVELQPENSAARESMADLERQTRPQLTVDGAGQGDNSDRDSLVVGPAQKVFLNDRLALSAGGRYLRYADNEFDTRTLDPASTAGTVALRAIGKEYGGELAYRKHWRTGIALSGGSAEFDDESSTPMSAEPRRFSVAALSGELALGEKADLSLRGQRGYVGAAGAILSGLSQRTLGGRVQMRPLRNTTLSASADNVRYSDGNVRQTLNASALQRLIQKPDVRVGYRFRSDDVRDVNPFFYSPDHFTGHDAVLQLDTEARGFMRFSWEAAVGKGKEQGTESQTEVSTLALARFLLGQKFNLYLSGGYNEAAEFRSAEAQAGMALTF